jgi:gluconate 5-dehydrogenase
VIANFASSNERLSTYTSVKGALDSFTHTAAAELGRAGITVNSLNLGVFVTEMSNAVLDAGAQVEDPREVGAAYASMTCLGRFGKVEDVEGITRLFASGAGSYITGAILRSTADFPTWCARTPI